MRFAVFVIIVFALFLGVRETTADDCPQYSAGVAVGALESPLINEASGIVASRQNINVLWTHNDSGDSARVFAMSLDGTHLGTYNLSGASARDYEDIAIGPGPVEGLDYLYIGDIGDNDGQYTYVIVYRVAEPIVDSNQLPVNLTLTGVDSIRLQYPGGPRDAETLMVDPVTKDIYIISKRTSYSQVYRAVYPQSTSSTTMMEYKTQLPWSWAVGGDISPAGNIVIVRGYDDASVWYLGEDANLWDAFAGQECIVPLKKIEPQGEAICFNAEGCGYYTVSESLYQPIYYFERQGQCNMAGDIIDDGIVNFMDFAAFADAWPLGDIEVIDLDNNGMVDYRDLGVFVNNWLEMVF